MTEEKKYTRNQIKWLRVYFEAEIRSMRSAVKVLDKTSVLKFEAQNEWRQQFKDQAGSFSTKEALDTQRDTTIRRFEEMNNKIVELQKFNSNLVGKISLAGVIWTLLIMVLTWLITKK